MINRLRYFKIPAKARRTFYRSITESYLRQSAPVLKDLTKAQWSKLLAAMKRAACNIAGAYRTASPQLVMEAADLNTPQQNVEGSLIATVINMKTNDIWIEITETIPPKRLKLVNLISTMVKDKLNICRKKLGQKTNYFQRYGKT